MLVNARPIRSKSGFATNWEKRSEVEKKEKKKELTGCVRQLSRRHVGEEIVDRPKPPLSSERKTGAEIKRKHIEKYSLANIREKTSNGGGEEKEYKGWAADRQRPSVDEGEAGDLQQKRNLSEEEKVEGYFVFADGAVKEEFESARRKGHSKSLRLARLN